jgi:hypothetical protein
VTTIGTDSPCFASPLSFPMMPVGVWSPRQQPAYASRLNATLVEGKGAGPMRRARRGSRLPRQGEGYAYLIRRAM